MDTEIKNAVSATDQDAQYDDKVKWRYQEPLTA